MVAGSRDRKPGSLPVVTLVSPGGGLCGRLDLSPHRSNSRRRDQLNYRTNPRPRRWRTSPTRSLGAPRHADHPPLWWIRRARRHRGANGWKHRERFGPPLSTAAGYASRRADGGRSGRFRLCFWHAAGRCGLRPRGDRKGSHAAPDVTAAAGGELRRTPHVLSLGDSACHLSDQQQRHEAERFYRAAVGDQSHDRRGSFWLREWCVHRAQSSVE